MRRYEATCNLSKLELRELSSQLETGSSQAERRALTSQLEEKVRVIARMSNSMRFDRFKCPHGSRDGIGSRFASHAKARK
jgi:hypothetical protein